MILIFLVPQGWRSPTPLFIEEPAQAACSNHLGLLAMGPTRSEESLATVRCGAVSVHLTRKARAEALGEWNA